MHIKKLILILSSLLFITPDISAQQDVRLMERIEGILKVTQAKDLDKILDYTYPKLFTIATREQMAEALKKSFETDVFIIDFDSVKLKTVFPVFTIKDTQYTKISYSMIMRMKFKTAIDSTGSVTFKELMEQKFGKGNISFNQQDNTFNIYMLSYLLAIKDDFSKDWNFVNYDEEEGMISLLFSAGVIEKLKEYK